MTTKTLTVESQTNTAKLELFAARRVLTHFVEMFDNGQWRLFYKEGRILLKRVRQARHVVEHGRTVVNKCDRGSAPVQ